MGWSMVRSVPCQTIQTYGTKTSSPCVKTTGTAHGRRGRRAFGLSLTSNRCARESENARTTRRLFTRRPANVRDSRTSPAARRPEMAREGHSIASRTFSNQEQRATSEARPHRRRRGLTSASKDLERLLIHGITSPEKSTVWLHSEQDFSDEEIAGLVQPRIFDFI